LWWAFDNLRKAREAAANAALPCWASSRLDEIAKQNAFAYAREQVEVERAKVEAALQDVKDALAALEA
jgi:glutaredoxin 2